MDDIVRMEIIYPWDYLSDYHWSCLLGKFNAFLNKIEQMAVTGQFQEKIKTILVAKEVI